jgi:putative hemolysin
VIFLIYLTLFLISLIGSAFFAAWETALMSTSLSGWERMRKDRPVIQTTYGLWSSNPSLVIAALLFGNMLTSLGASVAAGSMVSDVVGDYPLPAVISFLITTLLIGSTILFLGDILPKLYARHASEKVLLHTAGPLAYVIRFLSPPLKGLSALSDGIQKLLSFVPSEPLITAEELKQAVAAPYVEGLAPSARRILSNLISFDEVKVSEVMIPRNQIISVRLEQNAERVFEHIVRSGFSRVPVYFGNIDNIVGIVYAKDLLLEWRSSGLLVLEDLLRTPYRIDPEAPLSALLQGFRQGHHLAVVTDSRGRTQGIVTVEDVIEAIVGDIADEFDQPYR